MVQPVGVVLGLGLLVVGALACLRPRPVARFREQLDAVGSTTSLEAVEPTGWRVTGTRITGAVLALAGLLFLAMALELIGPAA